MVVIGLTGNIASGKSTVLRMLSELGAAIIDADRLGHKVLQHSEAQQEIVQDFGEEILGSVGEIDRGKLGKLVFSDSQVRERLNQITHPRMHHLAEEEIKKLNREGFKVVVLEAPLLIEAGWAHLVDQVWVTRVSEATAIRRLGRRFGFSEEEAKNRLNSQLPIEEKAKYADVVIETDSEDVALVRAQVESAWRNLFGIAIRREDIKQRLKRVLFKRGKGEIADSGLIPASELVPIYEKDGEHYILFVKRTEKAGYHKGEISFPGGVREGGESALDAALRESFEQIGLHPKAVEVLGELDDERMIDGNFIISPFVAFIPHPYEFKVNHEEVEELIPISFSELLDPANLTVRRLTEREPSPSGLNPLVYFYHIGERVIWGDTASILNKLFDLSFSLDYG
jgi:dephospho-CoA kinase